MEPRANDSVPFTSRSANAPDNVSEIDRELEAYLEEKRGKGGTNVEAQLAELQLKKGANSVPAKPTATSTSELTTAPPKEPPKTETKQSATKLKADLDVPTPADNKSAPSYAAGNDSTDTSDKTSTNKSAGASHESLIRALEEKYSASADEHNSAPAQPGAATKTPAPTPANAKKEASAQPEHKEAGESKEIVNSLRTSLSEEPTGELASVLSALEALPKDSAREIVREFEPKFARNRERKELYEKTKLDLETALAMRVKDQKTDPQKSAPATPPTSEAHSAPANTETPATPAKNTPSNQSTAPQNESQKEAPAPTQPATSRASESQQSQQSERKSSPATPSASGNMNTSPVAPKSVPTQSASASSESPATANTGFAGQEKTTPQQPSDESQEPGASEHEQIKQYVQKNNLLTVLAYDPEKGFIRKPVKEPEVEVAIHIDEEAGTARVEAKDTQGAVISSADVSLTDLG